MTDAPDATPPPTAAAPKARLVPERPTALLAIGMLGIVLGALGVIGGCMGVAGPLISDVATEFQRTQAGADPGTFQRQLEAQEALQEATASFLPFTLTHAALNLLASALLLVGSALLLLWKPRGPALFAAGVVANFVVDLSGIALQLIAQFTMRDAMRAVWESAATANPNAAPGTQDLMGGVAEATMMGSACLMLGFFVLKCAFYAWGLLYTRKPAIRALFT